MTTPDSKSEPARRTYASLFDARGFGMAAMTPAMTIISIQPMNVRTYWRHVEGTGKWNAKDALYEEVGL